MAEHTPGSWEVEDAVYVVVSASRDVVADCEVDFSPDIQEANARLIAAAPDLLIALEAAMKDHGSYLQGVSTKTYYLIRNALIKAKV